MALDAMCGMPQRPFHMNGGHKNLRNGLPQIADFEREFEALNLTDNGDADPMQILRPPFVSSNIKFKILARLLTLISRLEISRLLIIESIIFKTFHWFSRQIN